MLANRPYEPNGKQRLDKHVVFAVVVALFGGVIAAGVAALVADEAGVAEVGADVVVAVAVYPEVGAGGEFVQVGRPVGGVNEAVFFVVVPLGDEFASWYEVADDDARFGFGVQRSVEPDAAEAVQAAHGFRRQRLAVGGVDFAEVRQGAFCPAHRGFRVVAETEVRPQGGAEELDAIEGDGLVVKQGDVVFLADALVHVFGFVQGEAVVFVVAEDVEHRQFGGAAAQVVEEQRHGGGIADVSGEDEYVQFAEVADGAEAAFGVQVAVDADFHACSFKRGGF